LPFASLIGNPTIARETSKYADLKRIAVSTFRDCQKRQGFSKLQAFAFSFEHLGLYVDGDEPSPPASE
jgi:hypothetical protein